MAFTRPLLISNVQGLKLNYDNDGVQAYFKDLLKELNKCIMGGLLIKQFTDGVAGLYSKELYTDCITLNANDAFYNEKTKYLTLTDNGALTLLHEGSHFMHFAKDKGKFSAPCYKNVAPGVLEFVDRINPATNRQNRFMFEVEAGYRAICTAIMYDTGLEDKVAGDNLRNLLAYSHQHLEWLQYLGKMTSIDDVSFTIYNTVNELSLAICSNALEGHSFIEVEDINNFKVEPTARQKILIDMLGNICEEVYHAM